MEWIDRFNTRLLDSLEKTPCPSIRLKEALVYAARCPGKRLRPRFVREASGLAGLDPEAALTLGVALECVHLFSLIHDDLPALDNDDFRRGLPTLHRHFDEGTALLAGDELLNFAYATFTELASYARSDSFLAALRYFSRSIGREGMIGGQMHELEALQGNPEPDLETLLSIQDLKTGALFRASIVTPFLLAGEAPDSDQVRQVASYASAFGFAFQIADDLEDEIQDKAQARKNILSMMGRQSAIRLALERLKTSAAAADFSATNELISRLRSKL